MTHLESILSAAAKNQGHRALSREAVAEIAKDVANLNGRVNTLGAALRAADRIIERLEDDSTEPEPAAILCAEPEPLLYAIQDDRRLRPDWNTVDAPPRKAPVPWTGSQPQRVEPTLTEAQAIVRSMILPGADPMGVAEPETEAVEESFTFEIDTTPGAWHGQMPEGGINFDPLDHDPGPNFTGELDRITDTDGAARVLQSLPSADASEQVTGPEPEEKS